MCVAHLPDRGEPLAAAGRVVFASKGDLFTMAPDGGDVEAVDAGPGYAVTPEWSPDRSHVAFVREANVWIVDVAGGVPVKLTFDGSLDGGGVINASPTWSPDGARLAWSKAGVLHTMAPRSLASLPRFASLTGTDSPALRGDGPGLAGPSPMLASPVSRLATLLVCGALATSTAASAAPRSRTQVAKGATVTVAVPGRAGAALIDVAGKPAGTRLAVRASGVAATVAVEDPRSRSAQRSLVARPFPAGVLPVQIRAGGEAVRLDFGEPLPEELGARRAALGVRPVRVATVDRAGRPLIDAAVYAREVDAAFGRVLDHRPAVSDVMVGELVKVQGVVEGYEARVARGELTRTLRLDGRKQRVAEYRARGGRRVARIILEPSGPRIRQDATGDSPALQLKVLLGEAVASPAWLTSPAFVELIAREGDATRALRETAQPGGTMEGEWTRDRPGNEIARERRWRLADYRARRQREAARAASGRPVDRPIGEWTELRRRDQVTYTTRAATGELRFRIGPHGGALGIESLTRYEHVAADLPSE